MFHTKVRSKSQLNHIEKEGNFLVMHRKQGKTNSNQIRVIVFSTTMNCFAQQQSF